MPHADVVFLNIHYAKSHSPAHASTPRAYLLSLAASAAVAPHALLVAYWGDKQGSAVLSLPTREYFQSSGWVAPPPSTTTAGKHMSFVSATSSNKISSIKTGSAFWADGGDRTTDEEFSLNQISAAATDTTRDDEDNDSEGTETGREDLDDEGVIDDVGAQEAFVSGMIWALGRKMLPGDPYTPPGSHSPPLDANRDIGKWRLEECLK